MSATKLLRLTVSVLLLAAICWQTDWSHVGAALRSLRAELWLAAFGLLLVSQIVSTLRWRLFAQALRFEHSLGKMTGFYFIGMFFNMVLPTSVGGDVIRAWYLDGKSGRKLAAFASVFLDRLNGLMVLVAMACVAVLFSPIALPEWIPWSVAGIVVCGVLGLAALPIALRSGRLPAHRQRQLQTMLHLLREPRTLLLTTGLSLFVQGASVAIVWLIGAGLHVPIPAAYYWIMAPMVSLLTLLPVSVNGMGVREGGVVLFLTPLGVNQGTALTLAFLWFLVYAAGSLMGGVVYLAGAFPKPETPAETPSGDAPSGDAPEGEELLSYGPVAGDSDKGRTGQPAKAA